VYSKMRGHVTACYRHLARGRRRNHESVDAEHRRCGDQDVRCDVQCFHIQSSRFEAIVGIPNSPPALSDGSFQPPRPPTSEAERAFPSDRTDFLIVSHSGRATSLCYNSPRFGVTAAVTPRSDDYTTSIYNNIRYFQSSNIHRAREDS